MAADRSGIEADRNGIRGEALVLKARSTVCSDEG